MAIKIGPGGTDQDVTYIAGRFGKDNAFVTHQIGGTSPFGSTLASPGSDYFIELMPDGSGQSWFDGRPISAADGTGKAWYIKDQESGETWSAFHGPVCKKTAKYEVSFCPGVVAAYSLLNKVSSTVTIAVSPERSCEVWHVKLQNCSASNRTLTFTTYVRPRAGSALECKFLPKEKALVMRKPLEALDSERTGRMLQDLVFFHSSTLTPSRYQIEKSAFIGEGRSLINPEFLETTEQQEFESVAESAIASFSIDIDLPIEGEAEFGFCFGAARTVDIAREIIGKHTSINDINKTVNACRAHWKELRSTLQVESQDRMFDALMNTWLPYEACAEWIKEHAGAPHLDPYKAADSLRCLSPLYATAPDLCRESLLNFAARLSVLGGYCADGDSQVTLPPSEILWLAVCTARYVAETQDDSVLSRSVSLTDGPSLTLAEHCARAIRMCLYDKSALAEEKELLLLEQALRLWSRIAQDSDEFAPHLQKIIELRSAAEDTNSYSQKLPRRAQYLQSLSPSMGDQNISDMLGLYLGSTRGAGVASLIYSAISEQILGIEATIEGLILNPRLPESWSQCHLARKFRGDTYNIHIKRSTSKSKKNCSIVVDNEPVLGEMLPFFGDGKEHAVEMTVS
ncbi:MAG: hypothetical protein NT018_07925 [Armatimonadetes bacterium]|nr:hypothetical protein [Armatimonadota bacterium]